MVSGGRYNTRRHHFTAQTKLLLENLHVELLRVCHDPLILSVASLQIQTAAVDVWGDDAGVEAGTAELGSENHHVQNVTVMTKLTALQQARTSCRLHPAFRCLLHRA